jgi:rhizosphere induced protein
MQFELVAVNGTSRTETFCLYQPPEGGGGSSSTVAWFTKNAAPNARITFRWELSYDFVWGETGPLTPGAIFDASQVLAGNLTTENTVGLTYQNRAVSFTNLSQGPQQGTMMVQCDSSIPPQMLAAGLGMSGSATYVMQAAPNMHLMFTPRPNYFLAFGNFTRGQILVPDEIQNPTQINFPPNIFSMTATLNANGTWTIKSNPLPMA